MSKKTKLVFFLILFVAALLLASLSYKHLVKINNSTQHTTDITQTEQLPLALDFSVTNTTGKNVKLSDFYGKPIIVNFWTSWCPPCKAELPDFESAYSIYSEEIVFMMVNLTDGERETVKSVNQFIHKNNFSFPVYYDIQNDGARKYKIMSIPTTLFITREGKILDKRIGLVEQDYLLQKINQLLTD